MSLRLKIAANTLFQLMGKFFTSGFGLLTAMILAENYSILDFGDYVKITAYVTLFWTVADFGLNAIALQKFTESEEISKNFNRLLTLRIVWALSLIFVALAMLSFLPYDPTTGQGYSPATKLGIILMSLTVLSQSIHSSCNAVFQKFLVYQKTMLAAFVSNLVSFALIFLAAYYAWPIILAVAAYSFAGVILAVLSLALTKKYVGQITLDFNWGALRKMFLIASPLGLVIIFNVVYFHLDSFLLTLLCKPQVVAQYGLAYKFFETVLALPTFYGNSVYPMLLDRLKTDIAGFNRLFQKSVWLLLFTSCIVVLALIIMAPVLFDLVGKENYDSAVPLLRILALSFPIYFLTSIYMWLFVSLKKQMFLLAVYGSSLCLNLILNWLFIPSFGAVAAAAITGLSELYILLLFFWQKKKLNLNHYG